MTNRCCAIMEITLDAGGLGLAGHGALRRSLRLSPLHGGLSYEPVCLSEPLDVRRGSTVTVGC